MNKKGFVFPVGELIREDQGTKISYNFENEHELSPKVKGKVTFMRVEGGIHALLENIELDAEFICTKCTKKYSEHIFIDQAERVYNFEKQKDDADEFDTFYVEMKSFTINLDEFLRQEIILHFPLVPVCSKSCKGLCEHCGANLNEKKCKCKKEDEKKPLSVLKDIINKN